MARVSVIIASFNYGQYICQAIQSVMEQTFRDVEVIVVDDGSSDGTPDVVRDCFGDRVRLFTQPHSGPSVARNRGMEQAAGEYLSFLDADDYYHPTYVEKKVRYLDAHLDAGWVYSRCRWVNDQGEEMREGTPERLFAHTYKLQGWILDDLLAGRRMQTDDLFFRRQCLDRVKGFDPTLQSYEDYDFYLRLAFCYPVGFIEETLFSIRIHPGSLSQQRDIGYAARGRLIEKIECEFPAATTKPNVKLAWARFKADWHNYEGSRLYCCGDYHGSLTHYRASLRAWPFQGRAYVSALHAAWKGLMRGNRV